MSSATHAEEDTYAEVDCVAEQPGDQPQSVCRSGLESSTNQMSSATDAEEHTYADVAYQPDDQFNYIPQPLALPIRTLRLEALKHIF